MVLLNKLFVKYRTNAVKDHTERFIKLFSNHLLNNYMDDADAFFEIANAVESTLPNSYKRCEYMAHLHYAKAKMYANIHNVENFYAEVDNGLAVLGDSNKSICVLLASLAANTAHAEHNAPKLATYSEILEKIVE